MAINYTINNDVVTVFDEDFVPVSIDASHPNHPLVVAYLEGGEGDLGYVLDIMKPITRVQNAVKGTRITVTDDQVLFNGEPLHGTIVERILAGSNVDHLVKFLDKLMDNPSHRAVNQLYGFLEANNHAITADGNFVAYKIVDRDYKDLYTGRFDNSPGTVVSVPRNQVDEDPDRTCSRGLHVCGFYYLAHYGSVRSGDDRVVSVVINPAHVVAVPKDYNNAKMRVSEYTVLSDVTDKVKDKVGTTVGSDHPLSYAEWDYYESGDYWYDDIDHEDYDGLDYEEPWMDHDGSGFPSWALEPDDKVDVELRYGEILERVAGRQLRWDNDRGLREYDIVKFRYAE